jgi:hypothetical protein
VLLEEDEEERKAANDESSIPKIPTSIKIDKNFE